LNGGPLLHLTSTTSNRGGWKLGGDVKTKLFLIFFFDFKDNAPLLTQKNKTFTFLPNLLNIYFSSGGNNIKEF